MYAEEESGIIKDDMQTVSVDNTDRKDSGVVSSDRGKRGVKMEIFKTSNKYFMVTQTREIPVILFLASLPVGKTVLKKVHTMQFSR